MRFFEKKIKRILWVCVLMIWENEVEAELFKRAAVVVFLVSSNRSVLDIFFFPCFAFFDLRTARTVVSAPSHDCYIKKG